MAVASQGSEKAWMLSSRQGVQPRAPTIYEGILAPDFCWDEAAIHRCQAVKDFQAHGGAKRIHLERLPGYALELNPQEGVWNLLKRRELKNLCAADFQQLVVELVRAKERLRHRKTVLRQCVAHAGFPL